MEEHGNYLIKPIQVIGCGAFGRVEQIELYNTNGHKCGIYARKVLSVRKELVGPIFDYDDWRRRFEREVKYQAACSHFNVVPIYIHHLNSGVPWFVMDLAITDLKKEIRSGVLSNVEKTLRKSWIAWECPIHLRWHCPTLLIWATNIFFIR